MTKNIFSSLVGLVLVFAVAAPLYAGSTLNHEMKVTVPFAFSAGDKVLPSGDYTVQLNPERGTLVLRGEDRKPVMLLTTNKESASSPQLGKLVFVRYGTTFFLSEVWNQDNATGQTLARSAREKEMAKENQPEQILVVQAR